MQFNLTDKRTKHNKTAHPGDGTPGQTLPYVLTKKCKRTYICIHIYIYMHKYIVGGGGAVGQKTRNIYVSVNVLTPSDTRLAVTPSLSPKVQAGELHAHLCLKTGKGCCIGNKGDGVEAPPASTLPGTFLSKNKTKTTCPCKPFPREQPRLVPLLVGEENRPKACGLFLVRLLRRNHHLR